MINNSSGPKYQDSSIMIYRHNLLLNFSARASLWLKIRVKKCLWWTIKFISPTHSRRKISLQKALLPFPLNLKLKQIKIAMWSMIKFTIIDKPAVINLMILMWNIQKSSKSKILHPKIFDHNNMATLIKMQSGKICRESHSSQIWFLVCRNNSPLVTRRADRSLSSHSEVRLISTINQESWSKASRNLRKWKSSKCLSRYHPLIQYLKNPEDNQIITSVLISRPIKPSRHSRQRLVQSCPSSLLRSLMRTHPLR